MPLSRARIHHKTYCPVDIEIHNRGIEVPSCIHILCRILPLRDSQNCILGISFPKLPGFLEPEPKRCGFTKNTKASKRVQCQLEAGQRHLLETWLPPEGSPVKFRLQLTRRSRDLTGLKVGSEISDIFQLFSKVRAGLSRDSHPLTGPGSIFYGKSDGSRLLEIKWR